MTCKVCSHSDRCEIENALLSMSVDNPNLTIEAIAKNYKLTPNELKVHVLMHSPLGIAESEFDSPSDTTSTDDKRQGSLARNMKLREADMLMNVANEYMVTLKTVGKKINALANSEEPGTITLQKMLSQQVVSLYLGVGGEIRATVKTIADINQMLNGPSDNGSSGLAALANAISSSRNPAGGEVDD